MPVNEFTYGPLTPLLAYFMAFLGSVIGLTLATAPGMRYDVRVIAASVVVAIAAATAALWFALRVAMAPTERGLREAAGDAAGVGLRERSS